MEPQFLKIPGPANQLLRVFNQTCSFFPTPWHYHPEYELVWVLSSTGQRFIGHHVGRFSPGDVCLIGSNLPHYYRNDPDWEGEAHSLVIHFQESWIAAIPGSESILHLLRRSERGIHFGPSVLQRIQPQLERLMVVEGLDRTLIFMAILDTLSKTEDLQYLANTVVAVPRSDEDRMNAVYQWILQNYRRDIRLQDAAQQCHLTEEAFCRYFKKRTRKTFTQFVNDLRIDFACQQLQKKQTAISSIGFDSGYMTLSHFNRQFKARVGLSPWQYRAAFQTTQD
ncbi:MAG: AraC family transcriptional regulator [Spirosomataceae bacterium]